MFLWVTRSIARFIRWLIRKTRQVQHNMSHCGILAGEENKPKAGHVILSLFGSSSKVILKFFIWEGGKQDGHVTCLKHVTLGRTWWCRWKVDNATFHAGFCLGVGEHEGTHYNGQIPSQYHNTVHASSIFRLPLSIHSTVCRQGQEPRVSDGRLDSKSLPPSMQCELLCKTTQYLKSGIVSPMAGRPIVWFSGMAVSFFVGCFRGWKFGLRISSFLAFSFLVFSFAFVLEIILACAFVWVVRAKTTFLIAILAFLTSLSCLCFQWTTKQSPLLTKFRDLVLVLRQGMLFRFFRIYLCAFLFPFLFFFSAGGPYMGLPDTLSVVPCPETWPFIINVTLLASHFILGPLSKVVFSIVFHDGGSDHATDVSAHAEWRISHRAFRLTK